MVDFASFNKAESEHVSHIVTRALGIAKAHGFAADVDAMSIRMDLAAVHKHTPLRLNELAAADDFNLSHDVFGIAKHIDRETGELRDCFVPRYAAKQ